jgi:hypothetical protein
VIEPMVVRHNVSFLTPVYSVNFNIIAYKIDREYNIVTAAVLKSFKFLTSETAKISQEEK